MASSAPEAPQASLSPSNPASSVIRPTPVLAGVVKAADWVAILPWLLVSVGLHILMAAAIFGVILFNPVSGNTVVEKPVQTAVEGPETEQRNDEPKDPTNTDEGTDPLVPKGNDSPRQERMTYISPETDPLKELGNQGPGPAPVPVTGPVLPPEPGRTGGVRPPDGPQVPTGQYTPGGFEGRYSAATRILAATKEGGNPRAEDRAVALALEWLAHHQARDGSWSLDHFEENLVDVDGKPVTCHCGDPGRIRNNIAGTAFGLLPFLGAGLTPGTKGREIHNYTKTIEAGLAYLIKNQQSDGAFVARSRDREAQSFMYAHGLAAIVMCETASLVPEESKYRESAQKAIQFIVRAQHQGGGWRYQAGQAGDLSVTGWQVMALKSGQMAGLQVPRSTLDKASAFLDSVQLSDGGGYGYVTRPADVNEVLGEPTMTAAGLLCREYLGWSRTEEGLLKGAARLGQVPPRSDEPLNLYYYYYATQVLHHLGGDAWKDWNRRMRELLVARQDKGSRLQQATGHSQRGSWSPIGDRWGMAGGRLMETSLAALTLEVEYRYLPLYRQEMGGSK